MKSQISTRQARWLALWALLKGAESLLGHIAEKVKAHANKPELPEAS